MKTNHMTNVDSEVSLSPIPHLGEDDHGQTHCDLFDQFEGIEVKEG